MKKILKSIMSLTCGLGVVGAVSASMTSCGCNKTNNSNKKVIRSNPRIHKRPEQKSEPTTNLVSV